MTDITVYLMVDITVYLMVVNQDQEIPFPTIRYTVMYRVMYREYIINPILEGFLSDIQLCHLTKLLCPPGPMASVDIHCVKWHNCISLRNPPIFAVCSFLKPIITFLICSYWHQTSCSQFACVLTGNLMSTRFLSFTKQNPKDKFTVRKWTNSNNFVMKRQSVTYQRNNSYFRSFQIAIEGNIGSGKTSLLHHFLNDPNAEVSKNIYPTAGVLLRGVQVVFVVHFLCTTKNYCVML